MKMLRIKFFKTMLMMAASLGMALGVAHATPVAQMRIDEVTFSGDHTIYRDTGSQLSYPTPHWVRGRSEGAVPFQSPVCYTRNVPARVSAKFAVLPSNAWTPVKVKGVAGGYVFGPVDVTPSNGVVLFPATTANNPMPNTISFTNTPDVRLF